MAIIETGRVAHLIQEQTYKIAHEPFVEAGVGLGLSSWRLSKSYYFPALLPALAVAFSILTFNILGEGLRRHFNRIMNVYL
ncbi:hypothetical protein [Paenibacillus apiarius]|uniref:hypothetical protein n=1 Tax=Paenibacillus apiarius TaxID=46240 RepID=UPI001F09C621|nr:hypothetical protein [Paenibacillus apiarius]